MNQLHQWAQNERTQEFLRKKFKIEGIPCYYGFSCLLKMVKPKPLSRCLMKWAEGLFLLSLKPGGAQICFIAFLQDGNHCGNSQKKPGKAALDNQML